MPTGFHVFSPRLRHLVMMVLLTALMSGCSGDRWGFPYRKPVQQGNWVTKEQVALLKPGMTREQVRFALGSPTLTSVLHSNRWDYPYYYRHGNGTVEERMLTVFFENNLLGRWQGDEQPELQPFQIAKEEVKQSQQEEKQIKLDETRAANDAGIEPPIQILPGLDIQTRQSDSESVSTPNSLPGTPLSNPVPLQ